MNDHAPQTENPFAPSQHAPSPPPSRSRLPLFVTGCMTGIGLICAIFLLLVVVVVGLFIGFCGM